MRAALLALALLAIAALPLAAASPAAPAVAAAAACTPPIASSGGVCLGEGGCLLLLKYPWQQEPRCVVDSTASAAAVAVCSPTLDFLQVCVLRTTDCLLWVKFGGDRFCLPPP